MMIYNVANRTAGSRKKNGKPPSYHDILYWVLQIDIGQTYVTIKDVLTQIFVFSGTF